MTDLAARAEKLLEEALERAGARDPREFYRERLRELKASNPDGYAQAIAYYKDTLIPEVASGESDPLECWTEYGRRLAEAVAPGRTVSVDPSGLAQPFEPPAGDGLILHLPDESGAKALLVGLPPEPSFSAYWESHELSIMITSLVTFFSSSVGLAGSTISRRCMARRPSSIRKPISSRLVSVSSIGQVSPPTLRSVEITGRFSR